MPENLLLQSKPPKLHPFAKDKGKSKLSGMSAVKVTQLPFDDPYRQVLYDTMNDYNGSFGVDTTAIEFFLFAAKNRKGKIIGGAQGCIQCGWLMIFSLFSNKEVKGIGAMLMHRIENLAVEKNCKGIHVNTFDFQAPDFYKKHGFTVFAEIPGYVNGRSNIFLKKVF